MKRYLVGQRGMGQVDVEAANWIVALGLGLEQFEHIDLVERLACERLPNGTVIARDAGSGTGYVVQERTQVEAPDPQRVVMDEAIAVDAAPDDLAEIAGTEDGDEACAIALEQAQALVDAESGSVILRQREFLEFVAVVGPHDDTLLGMQLPLGTGVAGYSMEMRRSVVLLEAQSDPRHFRQVDELTGSQTRQMACVPVIHEMIVMGVIQVLNLPEGRRVTRENLKDMQRIANALACRLLAEQSDGY